MEKGQYIKTKTILDNSISVVDGPREFKGVTYLMIQNAGDYPARIDNWTIYPGDKVWFGNEYSLLTEDHYLEIEFLDTPIQHDCPPVKRLEFLTRIKTLCSCSTCDPFGKGEKVTHCSLCAKK